MIGVKICGFTNVADAESAVEAGAELLGLNFFAGSKRRIDLATARAIAAAVAGRALIVGVFVNHSAAEIHTIAQAVPLDVVQLHGDEPPSLGAELRALEGIDGATPDKSASPMPYQLWRAVRCRDEAATAAVVEWVKAFEVAAGRPLDALLVDAYDANEYGGTGRRADLSVFAALRQRFPHLPLWLAGGLTPENVASAIESAGPDGVDTASGVESAPGVKDADRMRRFVAAVLAAKPIARRSS
ncbi:MAG: phosphoribosylanthranilate isomerase [Planctomycetota bacterium]